MPETTADAIEGTLFRQRRIARNQNRLNVIAGLGLTLAVVAGVFGMNIFHETDHPGWPIDVFTLTAIGGFVLAAFAAVYIWADKLEAWFGARRCWQWAMVGLPFVLGGAGLLGMLFR